MSYYSSQAGDCSRFRSEQSLPNTAEKRRMPLNSRRETPSQLRAVADEQRHFKYKNRESTAENYITSIRECGSTLYVGMAQGVSLSLYIGIGAKFENTQKTGERRLRTAEYRTVLL